MSVVSVAKMEYDPYQTQKDIKMQNKRFILSLLECSPKRFTDLQKDTNFSPTGLTSILKRMMEENEIEKTTHHGKASYAVTNAGKQILERGKVTQILNAIEKNGGIYYYNYSGVSEILHTHRLMGGIYPYLATDRNLDKLNLLSTSDILDIEKFILDKLIKKRNKLKKETTGQLVFGFVIDYPKLINTIERDPKEITRNFADMLKILAQEYAPHSNNEMKKQNDKPQRAEKENSDKTRRRK
ncbi:MAG: hypothetical protein KC444_10275 [Nitrosopumilus sp.]|nr:hypothetical protein [Nitrosopumilus sp.]